MKEKTKRMNHFTAIIDSKIIGKSIQMHCLSNKYVKILSMLDSCALQDGQTWREREKERIIFVFINLCHTTGPWES